MSMRGAMDVEDLKAAIEAAREEGTHAKDSVDAAVTYAQAAAMAKHERDPAKRAESLRKMRESIDLAKEALDHLASEALR